MLHATGEVLNNRYRIVKLLGQGGFGAVYRAWDLQLNLACALKQNTELGHHSARRFAREANILAKLRHPNLPRVIDHFVLPDRGQYLVMEYIDGEDLDAKLEKANGPLPEELVLGWADQILDALDYLHHQQPPIIHRDIKPANIRITPQGQAVLVDFGIAKIYDPNQKTTEGSRAVTPGYSPYEQYSMGTTDPRTDIYSLGATLYTLLTGQVIHESVLRTIDDPVKPPNQLNPAISAATSFAIQRAIQVDPRRRWQSAADFKEALHGRAFPSKPLDEALDDSLEAPLPGLAGQGGAEMPLPSVQGQTIQAGDAGFPAVLGIIAIVILVLIGALSGLNYLNSIGWFAGDSSTRGALTVAALATGTSEASSAAGGATLDTLTAVPGGAGGRFRIGLLAPLSGAAPALGISAKQGADLAVKEWNAQGGVLGKQIEVVILDSQCEANPAAQATNRLIHQEGVRYIVGGVCSRASIPAAEIANQNQVVLISPVSTHPLVTVDENGNTRPFVFRVSFIDSFQGQVMAKFAISQGYQKAFVLYQTENDYGVGLGEAFAQTFAALGGQIVGKESFPASMKDFSALLRQVIASQAEVLFLPEYYPTVNTVGRQARNLGLSAVMMGGDGWDSPELDLSVVEGGFFTNHFHPGDTRPIMVKWLRRFGIEYNLRMPNATAVLTYDATNLLLTAIQGVGVDDPEQVAEMLAGMTWEGVSGTFYFDEKHNPIKSATVLTIRDGQRVYFTTVEP